MAQMSWQDVLRLPSGMLHVFMAFWMVPLPTTAALLVEATGLSLRSVHSHLVALCEQGLVVRVKGQRGRGQRGMGRWKLTLALEALGLGYPFLFLPAPNIVVDDLINDTNNNNNIYRSETSKICSEMGGLTGVSGQNLLIEQSGSGKNFPSSVAVDRQNLLSRVAVDRQNLPSSVEADRKSLPSKEGGNGQILPQTLPQTTVEHLQRARENALRPILEKHGIQWNWKTAQLAACSWVTADYIAAHVKAQPKQLGLAITLMLRGAPAPQNDENDERDDYYASIDFS